MLHLTVDEMADVVEECGLDRKSWVRMIGEYQTREMVRLLKERGVIESVQCGSSTQYRYVYGDRAAAVEQIRDIELASVVRGADRMKESRSVRILSLIHI